MAVQRRAVDLTQGSELRVICIFSIPLLIGNIFQQMYNVVDSVVVGNYVGYEALAAVGLCFPVIFTALALFMGIGVGTSVIVSQYRGAGDQKRLERAVWNSYAVVIIGCIPVSLIGVVGAESILRAIQVPEDVLPDATLYMQIYFSASFANLGFSINDGILRGVGDSRSSLRFIAAACFVNVVLDLLFVLAFHWDVAGVAVATIIAQILSWIWSTLYIHKHYIGTHTSLRSFRIDREILRHICRIGLPTGLQQMLFSFGTLVMQTMINGQGAAFIAGFNAASKIDMFAFLPVLSFASATTAFVGQNLGARRPDRIRRGVHSSMRLSMGVDIALVVAVLLLGRFILYLFNQDPLVIDSGMAYLYRIMPFYLLYTILSVLYAELRGYGDTLFPTMIMIGCLWLVRVPSAYGLLRFTGPENMFFCYGIGWVAEMLVLGFYYQHFRKRKREKLEQKQM